MFCKGTGKEIACHGWWSTLGETWVQKMLPGRGDHSINLTHNCTIREWDLWERTHSLDPLTGWTVAYCVQLRKTENLCLHRCTLSNELWYSRDAGQPKQSPLCLLLRDISPRREIWPLRKWNENLVFYMWKPVKEEISTIIHKMNLNTIADKLY